MVKITALPRDISPNEIIKVQNTSKCCPLCGETGGFGYTFKNNGKIQFTGIMCATYTSWYGKYYDIEQEHHFSFKRWLKSLKEKTHHWRIDHYICNKCGCQWDSEPYRTDLDETVYI